MVRGSSLFKQVSSILAQAHSKRPAFVYTVGVIAGVSAIFATLLVESLGYASSPSFNGPDACNSPHTPLDSCWDALAKTNGLKCSKMLRDTSIRGHIVPAGQTTCYKAIYYNADAATMQVLAWFTMWALLLMKTYERLVACLLGSSLRWTAAAAVLIGQISLWCACCQVACIAHLKPAEQKLAECPRHPCSPLCAPSLAVNISASPAATCFALHRLSCHPTQH